LDFTPLLAQLRQRPSQIAAALDGATLVLCSGSRALLGAWLNIPLTATHHGGLGHGSPDHGSPDHGGMAVVGAATTADEALQLVEQHQPTLLLCTDQLEQGDGATLVETVKRLHPPVRTLLVVSDGRRPQALRRAIAAHCDGICLESRVGQGTILAAVQSICSGGLYRDRALAPLLQRADGAADGTPLLTVRELEVLEQLQRGLSNQQIATKLFVSIDTVKTHVKRLLQKLGAHDRGHAAVLALKRGLIEWHEVSDHG
jgi:DNA-binding NarL/FixJ family response regulator